MNNRIYTLLYELDLIQNCKFNSGNTEDDPRYFDQCCQYLLNYTVILISMSAGQFQRSSRDMMVKKFLFQVKVQPVLHLCFLCSLNIFQDYIQPYGQERMMIS